MGEYYPIGRFEATVNESHFIRNIYCYKTLSGTTKYILYYPTPQNAINIFAGEWSSRFPAGLAVQAGNLGLFDDPRVHALASKYDALPKWHVLELGPLEGGHTSIFHG